MKIKDVIQESVYDFFTKQNAALKQANAMSNRQQTYRAGIVPSSEPAPEPTQPAGPEIDISKTVPADTQYKFRNPEVPGGFIIIRQTGYYVDSLPAALKSQVKRDKATGLYPVLRAENIKKYNEYYNAAADANRVREEPVHAL